MSTEADLRAALVAHAALVAALPAGERAIGVDAVAPDAARPYVVLAKQASEPVFGLLGDALLGSTDTIDVQVIGSNRANAIAVRELVQDALLAAGRPWAGAAAGYDPENDLEAEVVTVRWLT
jgi:hypothetical protein